MYQYFIPFYGWLIRLSDWTELNIHLWTDHEFEQTLGDSEWREPGVLQSVGSQRIRCSLVTDQRQQQTDHIFFNHLPADEHLGCSHLLSVMNNVTIKIWPWPWTWAGQTLAPSVLALAVLSACSMPALGVCLLFLPFICISPPMPPPQRGLL